MTTEPALAGGGQSATVTKSAALLTIYAPVTIINTSSDRVWLADSSSVGAGYGVPVDPGTSFTWQTAGAVWAVLDPAATDTSAAVILTNAGGTWQPSPAAIGTAVADQLVTSGLAAATGVQVAQQLVASGLAAATGVQVANELVSSGLAAATGVQVAEQLLAGGLPVVAKTAVLFTALSLGPNTATPQLTTIDYSTLYVRINPGFAIPNVEFQIFVDWRDTSGGIIVATDKIVTVGGGATQTIAMPCKADYATVTTRYTGSVTYDLTVVASTRPADRIRITYPSVGNTDDMQLAVDLTVNVSHLGTTATDFCYPVEGGIQWSVRIGPIASAAYMYCNYYGAGGQLLHQDIIKSYGESRLTLYTPLQAQQLNMALAGSTVDALVTIFATRIPI